MKCPGCQSDNPEDAKFCIDCGAPMERSCPSCGAPTPAKGRFCKECGQVLTPSTETAHKDLSFDEKIAKIQRYLPEGLTEKILSQRERIEGERKQVTVMFCDLEGFTALTERLGPEEAYVIMDDVYEILIHKVHDYEGTVNEMTGDGIVALFGAPISLEDAPQRAIRSAIAIHREMNRFSDTARKEKVELPLLKMRVGIHAGPVVVGTLGNDLRVDFKAVGDTVNLASRMEELASPGTTYVTEDTFKLTEGFFRFEALGTKAIKGKEELVNVYQVIAPSTRRTRFDVSAERGLTPFVGRERELEHLLDGFERAQAGRGQAFSIVAEAGVGKSRLLYEFRKAVTNEDVTFLEGRALSYSRGVAYHPVIDMLKSSFEIDEGDGDPEITRKLQQGLRVLGVNEPDALPYLLELLSVEGGETETAQVSPETRKARVVEALRMIVLRSSGIRPLIMAFEDLHWVDKNSEDVLKSLLESIPGARVLLIFTYRPQFVHTWGGKSYHSQLNLIRLSNRESLSMATHLLQTEEIDRDLEELILEKTEGIPFFIEEFVKSLREQEIIEKRGNRCQMAKDIKEATIPSTIQDVIMARVDSLPEGAKEVLQIGAVIDREFSYELIKEVSGLPEQDLLSRLSGLRDSELLYERGVFPENHYVFKHALTQEVAYDGLLEKRRKEIHEKIARAIEELSSERLEEYYELLAYHYVRSDDKKKAVEYLGKANQKAAKVSALQDAKAYFEKAMKILDTLPGSEKNQEKRLSLLVDQAMVFHLLSRDQEYYDLLTKYEPIAAKVENAGLVGAFYGRLGLCEHTFGYFDQATQTLTNAAKLCEEAGNIRHAGHAYSDLQWNHVFRGAFERALSIKEDALRAVGQGFDSRTYISALSAASAACSFLGRWDEAVEYGQKALEGSQEGAENYGIVMAANIISIAYTLKGDLGKGIEYVNLAVQNATTPFDEAWTQPILALVWCRAGEPERGIGVLAALTSVVRAARQVPAELALLSYLGEGYWMVGEYDKARQTAEEAVELAERCGARYYIGWSQRLLGEIALKTNQDDATLHFEQAISIFQKIKAENELALAYSGLGRYHKQQGKVEEAREYLTKALEIFERLGTLIEPDRVKKELAELPQ
ncbi:MAG: hypothetical protein AMK69_22260 [Nitrospira bacterium SG8_3]|nr:MAG: hypothetical protein AMK69_22260 [Nitrospira bacterium SG8_3]